ASRWIDVVENEGKRSGAYSSGVYDTAPYILLNWQDNLDNLFTLVHEMGHSMHTYLTTHNQPYQYGDYPIFLAEIASTTNENLLTQYLLETQKDPQVQAYVLNHYLDGFKGTVFRQAQFAQFELWLHEQEANGQALTAEKLADYYGKLNQHYYGSAVVNDQQIAYEWARIPHFYYNFYVYQYATGFAAATTLSQNILSKDPAKLTAYLDYLKAGSSNYPLEVMKQAGVNMEESAYLQEAFKVFEKRLNQLEGLLLK
ncbi:MAG: M3 family metallopeptidase, partial [Ligilactobacillus agilis]|nr:M3 family metallopeptidase [Ligilactobacillus agilis]